MNRGAWPATIVLACVSVLALAACGTQGPTGQPASRDASQPASPPIGEMPVRPHFQHEGKRLALATGWLERVGLEGGFWALVAQPPGSVGQAPSVIAVLLPGKVGAGDLARHQGAYLITKGRIARGGSIREAGPEIRVDSIKLLGMGQ